MLYIYLLKVIHARLGTIIQGQADSNDSRTFFTDSYLAQNTARIRGTLSALTRYLSGTHLYIIFENLFIITLFNSHFASSRKLGIL